MKITVKASKTVWESPDGKVTIWEVMDTDGNAHKTMSKAIAEGEGKEFDCESYTKGKNTYIKQVAKDEEGGGGYKPKGGGYSKGDDSSFVVSYTKDIFIARLNSQDKPPTHADFMADLDMVVEAFKSAKQKLKD